MKTPSVHVKKFGGTSLGSVERIERVAGNLVRTQQRGVPQVVVVSAIGKHTDYLRETAMQIHRRPSAREMDMLLSSGEQVSIALVAMAVEKAGGAAISMTGAQSGIVTDGSHLRARIRGVNTHRIREELNLGRVVIVAGFQGITDQQQITTLGRGGSDITAAALAAALQASECEIFTDVSGVFTADPRMVPSARLLEYVGHDEMLEYAASGSKVLHPRCVEIARSSETPIRVRSSFEPGPGTLIVKEDTLEKVAITGVTGESEIARVALERVADSPGIAAQISQTLADGGVNVRLFIQSQASGGSNDVCLIVDQDDGERSVELLRQAGIGSAGITLDADVAKVSIVGSGIASTPDVAARMFRALGNHDVNIELITSSEVRIACIIANGKLEEAIRAIHAEFELDKLQRALRKPMRDVTG